MKIKELKKWKKYYSEKKLTKLSWPMSAKSDQKISYLKSKKKKKKKKWQEKMESGKQIGADWASWRTAFSVIKESRRKRLT